MSLFPPTAQGCVDLQTDGGEPDFDVERVIWDADYRRDVIERLRQWRARHARLDDAASGDRKAA